MIVDNTVTIERPGIRVTVSEHDASIWDVADAVRDALKGLGFSPENIASAL